MKPEYLEVFNIMYDPTTEEPALKKECNIFSVSGLKHRSHNIYSAGVVLMPEKGIIDSKAVL